MVLIVILIPLRVPVTGIGYSGLGDDIVASDNEQRKMRAGLDVILIHKILQRLAIVHPGCSVHSSLILCHIQQMPGYALLLRFIYESNQNIFNLPAVDIILFCEQHGVGPQYAFVLVAVIPTGGHTVASSQSL